jgi:hypothetical protein
MFRATYYAGVERLIGHVPIIIIRRDPLLDDKELASTTATSVNTTMQSNGYTENQVGVTTEINMPIYLNQPLLIGPRYTPSWLIKTSALM